MTATEIVPCRVFPAGAGMNRPGAVIVGISTCVPRRRGDEPPVGGARKVAELVFPAGAGMNRNGMYSAPAPLSVPRRRGDEPE